MGSLVLVGGTRVAAQVNGLTRSHQVDEAGLQGKGGKV